MAIRATALAGLSAAILMAGAMGPASPARAVVFNEAAGGDIDGQGQFLLDLGVNMFTGMQTVGAAGYDFDNILFRAPPGVQIDRMTLFYTGVQPLPGTTVLGRSTDLEKCGHAGPWSCSRLASGETLPVTNGLFNIADPLNQNVAFDIFTASFPLGHGHYGLSNWGLRHNGGGGAWTYTFTVETSATNTIPAPPSALLAGSGLAALWLGYRRRRKRG